MDIEHRQQKSSTPDLRQQRAMTASLIARLMTHYWTADDPPEIRRAQAQDWMDDLAEFGPDIVSIACGEWRRTQTRRPTIADIRLICIREQQDHRAQQPALMAPSISLEEARDNYAKSVGFDSWAEREEAARQREERYARAAEWRKADALAPPAPRYTSIGEALGATAREFTPSAESLAAGRRAFGLEPAPVAEEPAA